MLNGGADGCGHDLTTMGLLFRASSVATQSLGSFNDRWERNLKPGILQPLTDAGVVEACSSEKRL